MEERRNNYSQSLVAGTLSGFPALKGITFEVIEPVIVGFRDMAQLSDRFEYLSHAFVSLKESPVDFGGALSSTPFVILLHAGDDFYGLSKRLVAFRQLLQTFLEVHTHMVRQASDDSTALEASPAGDRHRLGSPNSPVPVSNGTG